MAATLGYRPHGTAARLCFTSSSPATTPEWRCLQDKPGSGEPGKDKHNKGEPVKDNQDKGKGK